MPSRLGLASFASMALAAVCVTTPSAADAPPTAGSSNTATADPPVSRPSTTPCAVSLYTDFTFADFSAKPFSFAPPTGAGCEGPWAKIVLEADFSVTAGRQFDRTANMWIGGANVYFGTTAEPSRTVAPTWHVERDLTDYAALLSRAQPGEVDLGNLVNATYTGVLHGSARLLFYPEPHRHARAHVPDVVLPLSAGPTGGTVSLAKSTDALTRTFTLPTNIERAYLDVLAQSQAGDEFWYTCAPDDVAASLQSCGGTGFRQVEVAIDGAPAGVAPVFPWIYTGGIDPYLWRPIPGVETLNLEPYRVDLTPFAGALSDGKPHQVSVRVFGAQDHFSTTATLLLYLDHGSKQVTGEVTSNTLTADPTPAVKENLTTAADGSITGTIDVSASRRLVISGTARTSHGEVRTTVTQSIDFSNHQDLDVTATSYAQKIAQATRVVSLTLSEGGGVHRETLAGSEWPLTMDIGVTTNADGSSQQTTTARQERAGSELVTEDGLPIHLRVVSNVVSPADTLAFDKAGAFLGPRDQASTQRYFSLDDGACYSRDVTAAAGLVSQVKDGAACGR
jgi:hypothetical protein